MTLKRLGQLQTTCLKHATPKKRQELLRLSEEEKRMKRGMRKVLEDVVTEVLRRLPPEVPNFNKVVSFEFRPTIYKVKRKTK